MALLISDKSEDPSVLEVTSLSAVPTAVHNETLTPLPYNPEENEAEPETDIYYDKDDCTIQEYEIMKVRLGTTKFHISGFSIEIYFYLWNVTSMIRLYNSHVLSKNDEVVTRMRK